MEKILKVIETGKCVGCGNCLSVCAFSAIEFKIKNGFQYPAINIDKCANCRKCDKVCPANEDEPVLFSPNAYYAAYVNQNSMNPQSTSGGICTLASEAIIDAGGVVFSVQFTDDWNVEYSKSEKIEQLKKHIGSKYMQASFNNVQKNIAEELKFGKLVLLIGTPCLVGAVKKYLQIIKINCENFITIDFLCHGVPSAEVGKTFIKSLEKKTGRKLENYNFRSKGFGWGKLSRSIQFEGKPEKSIRADFCPLHTWFGQHLSLRESCFECDYRNVDRPSDITVADFWKIDKYYPDIPTKQGVSAVQINTDKGKRFYSILMKTGKVISRSVSKESIWEHRRTALQNFPKPAQYDEFWKVWNSKGLDGILKLVPAQTISGLILSKIKSMVK